MTKLITQNFKTHMARQFVESFTESANTIYYVTAHKSTPFTNDASAPSPENTQNYTHYELYDDMLFGKRVSPSDVKHMIRNIVWTSGTLYDAYDDLAIDLQNKNFYVSSLESGSYHIFKCLFNNNGAASTDQPLFSEIDAEDEIYLTTDGYQWKYMYSISPSVYSKFATSDFIPVVENANVTNAAIEGAIDTILITNPGSQYNSYAFGTVKESAVSGNTLLFSLNGEKFTDYLVTVPSITGFKKEEVTSLNTNNKTASGVVVALYSANNTMRITSVLRNFTAGRTIIGATSNTSQTISSATKITAELSSNTDFYKNNSFYIRSGKGAGQLRTITEYIVTGDERRVLLNSSLDVLPDSTSIFEIGPRVIILGDGLYAKAVATVNPATSGIEEIEIINSGINYTYADIQIVANTGLIDSASTLAINSTSAQARAIISPPGGHGSNVINELFANKVGIGMSFANTETNTISTDNDFRKISILKEPLFANVQITLADTFTATSFAAGETILQANTGASGTVVNRDGSVVRLSNVRGFFATGSGIINANTVISGREYIIIAPGNTNFVTFGSSSNTVNTIFTATVNGSGQGTGTVLQNLNVIRGQRSNYFSSIASINKSVETFDQRQIFQVEMLYAGPTGAGFVEDELVIQEGLSSVGSDIITLTIDRDAYEYSEGEVITQTTTGATGVISARYDTVLTLTNITGNFAVGNNITGGTTGKVSAVSSIDNTFQANAIGYVHSRNSGATSTVIGLTNVKGFFSVSDDSSGTINTFVGQTSKAEAKITGRSYDRNYVVDGSGEFLYTENFTPVDRSASQTEKVKLIIEF